MNELELSCLDRRRLMAARRQWWRAIGTIALGMVIVFATWVAVAVVALGLAVQRL